MEPTELDARKQTVEDMPHLMHERHRIIVPHQCRAIRRRFREVGDHSGDGVLERAVLFDVAGNEAPDGCVAILVLCITDVSVCTVKCALYCQGLTTGIKIQVHIPKEVLLRRRSRVPDLKVANLFIHLSSKPPNKRTTARRELTRMPSTRLIRHITELDAQQLLVDFKDGGYDDVDGEVFLDLVIVEVECLLDEGVIVVPTNKSRKRHPNTMERLEVCIPVVPDEELVAGWVTILLVLVCLELEKLVPF